MYFPKHASLTPLSAYYSQKLSLRLPGTLRLWRWTGRIRLQTLRRTTRLWLRLWLGRTLKMQRREVIALIVHERDSHVSSLITFRIPVRGFPDTEFSKGPISCKRNHKPQRHSRIVFGKAGHLVYCLFEFLDTLATDTVWTRPRLCTCYDS